jgi:hypothetical protein
MTTTRWNPDPDPADAVVGGADKPPPAPPPPPPADNPPRTLASQWARENEARRCVGMVLAGCGVLLGAGVALAGFRLLDFVDAVTKLSSGYAMVAAFVAKAVWAAGVLGFGYALIRAAQSLMTPIGAPVERSAGMDLRPEAVKQGMAIARELVDDASKLARTIRGADKDSKEDGED